MHLVVKTFGRAVLSQLHLRMLLLTVLPFVLSVFLWGLALWLGLQPMMDWLGAYFADSGWYHAIRSGLDWMGLSSIRTFLVPLIAMWLLLPLMILTALLFVGGVAMPAIARHVSTRWYPDLEQRHGGSIVGSLAVSLGSFVVFACLWLVTLPLNAVPPLALLVQPLLWGWLTYRVMAYDALADHASKEERRVLMRQHRLPLLAIGIAVGAMGAAPTMLWLGGALFLVVLPLMAGVAIWVYVLVFVFSGLWFQHYLLAALEALRRDAMQTDRTMPAAT